eukprot:tig00000344_g24287.t1
MRGLSHQAAKRRRRSGPRSNNFAGAEPLEPPSEPPSEPPPGSDESDLVQGSLVWNSAYDLICGEYGGQECRRLERDVALVRAAVAEWRLEERSEALEEALEEAEALRLELAEMDPAAPAREDGLTRDQMLANLQAFTAKATDELCTLMRDYLTVDAVCADLATYTQLMPDPESPTWLSIPEVLLSFISSTARVRAFLGRLRPLEPHEVAELGRHLFSHCVRKHQSGYAQSYCSSHFDHEEANAVSNMMSLVADTGDSRIERRIGPSPPPPSPPSPHPPSAPPAPARLPSPPLSAPRPEPHPLREHVVGYGRFLSVGEQEIRSGAGWCLPTPAPPNFEPRRLRDCS